MHDTRNGRSLANVGFWLAIAQLVLTILAPVLLVSAPDGSQKLAQIAAGGFKEGVILIFCSICLGVLCEISSSLSRQVAAGKST